MDKMILKPNGFFLVFFFFFLKHIHNVVHTVDVGDVGGLVGLAHNFEMVIFCKDMFYVDVLFPYLYGLYISHLFTPTYIDLNT